MSQKDYIFETIHLCENHSTFYPKGVKIEGVWDDGDSFLSTYAAAKYAKARCAICYEPAGKYYFELMLQMYDSGIPPGARKDDE